MYCPYYNYMVIKTNSKSQVDSIVQGQIIPPELNYFNKHQMREIEELLNLSLSELMSTDIDSIENDICNAPIRQEEVIIHLRKLKNKKAPGYDGIVGEFLKFAPENIVEILYLVFNAILDRGEWPEQWATGLISPVHKKGCINECDNYRKITVMPVIGKVLESILNSRLVQKNVVLNIDDPFQFGFINGCQTTDNIFILNAMISKQKAQSKALWVCFVDFTKAFDYVNRNALYYKLMKRGVKGKMLQIIKDMYTKAKCRVKWKGNIGNELDSQYGVLQGGMLSPRMFTEYLTDLGEYLDENNGVKMGNKTINYLLYADDMILCSETKNGLQNLIDGLYKFCKDWHLIVSLTKTNVVVFGNNTVSPYNMKFGKDNITPADKYKYLGAIFSNSRNTFKENQTNLADKARHAIFSLNAHAKVTIGYLQPSLALKMFDAQVSPILEYAAEVWYSKQEMKNLEKIHLKYLKRTLNVKVSSSNLAIYSELGRFPLDIKVKYKILKYWKRILEFDENHPVRIAYNTLTELERIGKRNWCSQVKEILTEVGRGDSWVDQTLSDSNLHAAKETMYRNFMNLCMEDINNVEKNPKLRTYRLFKKEYKLENYLSQHKNLSHTLALVRFRISSHNLAIETGRYTRPKTPEKDRLCIYCNENQVENEEHFLLHCSKYTNERTELYRRINTIIPQVTDVNRDDRFQIIMSCQDQNVLEAVGKYVFDCMNIRNRP